VRLRVRARELSVESTSWDYRRMIIYAESPDVPGRYYLYEPGTESLRLLGVTYPELDEQPLSPMRPVRYKARDGLEIPGYLSLPPGSGLRPATPLPAVVMPHGGPYVRDFAAFDPLVQLLTSRGYAVLQMNYRGSTGYGAEFQAAGQRQWGKAMQDDVTDGTAWLVAEGIADPARICIVGWSYGGYAALMGAAKEPDRYRCSVSIAGVADLRRLVESSNKYLYGRVSTRFIGDAWRDRKDLTENSPARRASAIRVPVLLAHGTKDRVVDPDQSRMMAAALKSAGRSFEYIELKDADHSVTQMPQRQQLFDAVDRFLGQYLGGS
jgi:dipeptidyl aminopeptidase/acylaminoacyl peptidase